MPKGVGRLLNRPGFHSTAAISGNLSKWGYSELHISDCDRKISLEFNFSGAEKDEYENSLYKLDQLTEAIEEFRSLFIAAHKKKVKKDAKAAKKLAE